MKRLSVLFLILFAFTATIQAQETENGPKITFEQKKVDFGDITEGEKVSHEFVFENTGNEVLLISDVLVQCGCTATDWPKDPIPPGEKGSINVVFNSTNKRGVQNKVVTVVSNSTTFRDAVSLRANVIPKAN
ncbi:DUF1573 domain-containing protein [Mangrovivirga sp. M17]|uniref:DUF1573 domain-containing protein n=2 Tax=Mangrovivirga TaxID=2858886 RepID=A0A4D7K9R2_9BACT|nr:MULTISPECIES: DUF1573 domain-containing protein [Mangrovivirga]MCX2745797.1 DUF1573 domain-containing protein [Mangrovivirga halotolerans]QCK16078.1 hypothetical protein DCC35_15680 [Mangrovivirga cuniculi]